MRLLGILNQIRILLEEQNDLLREIHLATRGTPPLTPKRRPSLDQASPFRKRPAETWIRPSLTEDRAAQMDQAQRESAAASVSDEPPIQANPDSATAVNLRSDPISDATEGSPA